MKKSFEQKNAIYMFLTFAAALGIISLALWRLGIYPFGDMTLVYHDMQYQYVDFFMWFHNVLHGKDSLGYSFSAGLGGNTIALFAYYLASPLNLLVYFIEQEDMAQFLTLLIGLKMALCGSTAYFYIRKRFDIPQFYSVMTGVSYALMGWNVLQCSNIMWLDGVIVLPLIALGIYRMIWEDKRVLYFVMLFYGVFSNWYIGFMLCLFAVLYYVFEYVLFYMERRPDVKAVLQGIVWFGVTSVLSVAAAGLLFLPQTLHMSREGRGFDWTIFRAGYNFSFLDGFRDFFLDSEKVTVTQTHPPIYIGMFVLLLASAFFFSKKVQKYKKYLAGTFLIGVMFIFQYKPLNYVFTAFRIPASHAYRYGFIFSFFMIAVAGMCIREMKETDVKAIKGAALAIVLSGLFIDYIRPYEMKEKTYLSFFIAIIMGVCIVAGTWKKTYITVVTSLLLAACLVVEFSQKMQLEFADHQQSASSYVIYNQQMKEAIEKLKQTDDGIYRIDKDFTRTVQCGNNESMAFGYSSAAQYTSTGSTEAADNLRALGYTSDITIVPHESVLVPDSLLGIKYIYAKRPVAGSELVEENVMEGVNLYKNPYALPIGFKVDENLGGCEYGENALANHELLLSNITGKTAEIYSDAEILSEEKNGDFTVWNVKATQTGPLYCYFAYPEPYMNVYVNGEQKEYLDWYENYVMYIGEFEVGDTVQIRVQKGENLGTEGYGFSAATLQMEQFSGMMRDIQSGGLNVSMMQKNRLKAEYENSEASRILLTIPYEKGWNIRVNGEEVPYEKAANAFISLKVPAGKSVIEMDYDVPGVKEGFVISGLAIAVFIVLEQMRKKRKRNEY